MLCSAHRYLIGASYCDGLSVHRHWACLTQPVPTFGLVLSQPGGFYSHKLSRDMHSLSYPLAFAHAVPEV